MLIASPSLLPHHFAGYIFFFFPPSPCCAPPTSASLRAKRTATVLQSDPCAFPLTTRPVYSAHILLTRKEDPATFSFPPSNLRDASFTTVGDRSAGAASSRCPR